MKKLSVKTIDRFYTITNFWGPFQFTDSIEERQAFLLIYSTSYKFHLHQRLFYDNMDE